MSFLDQGLPKPNPKDVISELKSTLYSNDNFRRFFPDERESKYKDNFKLFDRNSDGILSFDELQELLISIGQIFEEDDLKALYEILEDQEFKGINIDSLFVLVSKKIRDQDIEAQLLDAFKIINGDNDTTGVDSEMLKEYLMTMGNKLSEEQTDEIIKEFNPKGDKTFEYPPIVNKLMKR